MSKHTSVKYHGKDVFSEMKSFIFTNMAPLIIIVLNKCSLSCIYMTFWWFFGTITIQTTFFTFMNQYFNDKSSIFLTEVNFDTLEGNQLSYFQNGLFFKILWWFHEAHNWVKCRWKNTSIFSTFHGWKIDKTFVTFISNKSLSN